MGRRFAEIDALKAIGILTVVLIHSLRWPFDPAISAGEEWLGRLTRFAVPAFLMASGFLYAGGPPPSLQVTLRRLRRIGIPYLFASLIGQAWWAAQDVATDTDSWLLDLLFGSSMGPYYYVFVIACLVLATPLFALVPTRAMPFVAVVLAAAQWWVDAASGMLLPFFWTLRNPLLWWAYFALGWIVRQHYDGLRDWILPRRRGLLVGLTAATVVLSAASGLDASRLFLRTATWLDVYAICALIFTATCGKAAVSPPLRTLSDTSYPIYLLHFFFVLAATDLVPPPPFRTAFLPIVFPWVAGLLGSISIIAALKALLGKRSRDWIGA